MLDRRLPEKEVICKNPLYQKMSRNFSILLLLKVCSIDKKMKVVSSLSSLVLSSLYKKQVLKCLHDDAGHPARDRNITLFRESSIGQAILLKIGNHVDKSPMYLRLKSNVSRAPIISIEPSFYLDLVTIDVLQVDQCKVVSVIS